MVRGDLFWADLPDPVGSAPGFRRPVLVVQSDPFNASRIGTVLVAAVTSNMALAQAPGNVRLARRASGLPKDSVVNVSQILTVDRLVLARRIGRLPPTTMEAVDQGLRLALAL
jgi:mRNA interferase MazF